MLVPVLPTYLPCQTPHAMLTREIKDVVLLDSVTRPPEEGDPHVLCQLQLLAQPQPKPPLEPELIFPCDGYFHKPLHVVRQPPWRAQVLVSMTPIDVEDSDSDVSDDFPVILCTRPLHTPAWLPAAESDDENPLPRASARTRGTSRRCGRGSATAPTRAATANKNEPGSVYIFIQPETLVKTKKSADSDYFFGHREIDKGFKCRLCPQEYRAGSSLSTRHLHLQNTEGHMEVYIAAVQEYGFANKLPEYHQQKEDEQCLVNAQPCNPSDRKS
ncbi:hypothetical protein B0H16DRAFT_1745409 [Mycena metata]|uniref:Uncharacterized protein n=1 Tax=Mycena metata TaxID=1033252 RepID=A0AAD7H3P1_9AGAR|nr:hypothetical protein B0H16DRAFT_1745409 [Mycena metata]